MSISKDLRVGEAAENRIILLLQAAKIKAVKNDDKSTKSDYDLQCSIDKQPFTVEVKHDLYASKSGNVAIEIFNPKSGKNSGLNITKADLWCHIVNGEAHFISTKKLKQFVADTKPKRVVGSGGDDNASLLLFATDTILPHFTRLNDLKPKQVKILIKKLLKDGV